MKIDRSIIITGLKNKFESDKKVYALWLEGADSNNAVDQYSDIDIWFDVEDGYEDAIMKKVQGVFSELAPLDLVQKYNHPHPKIRQSFFHIKGTSEFLLLDVCIQSHSRKFAFVKEMTHELPLVIFDKAHVTKIESINRKKFKKELQMTVEELKKDIAQRARMTKYIHRGQFLEAIVYYHKWILQPLVELLRIKYAPTTHDMYLVHISQHLPKQIVERLEDLFIVKSVDEIDKKSKKAVQFFRDTISKL